MSSGAIRRRLRALAYPAFDCELCVGQEHWAGCYCAYHGAVAPCEGPEWWRAKLQRLLEWWG